MHFSSRTTAHVEIGSVQPPEWLQHFSSGTSPEINAAFLRTARCAAAALGALVSISLNEQMVSRYGAREKA